MEKFNSGELAESNLTFKDLESIKKSFVQIVAGFFHQRIEYPGGRPDEGAKRRTENGDQSSKSTTEGPRRDGVVKKGGARDAARTGTPDGGV
jgi:hypothetical protein